MMRVGHNRGFTLVEMLVVISIIVVLIAILVPVVQGARHRARMVKCTAQMHDIMMAMTEYKRQYHRFPPRPIYDNTAQMYIGGFSALYPDFIDVWEKLVCPDDRSIVGQVDAAKARRYSSYNGRINLVDDPAAATPWDFAVDSDTGNQAITYNFNGYDEEGWDRDTPLVQGTDTLPTWLSNANRNWRDYPRLMNRYAPDYTMVVHCTFHRDFYHKDADKMDVYIKLNSDTGTLPVQQWQATDADGASLFMKQD